MSVYIPGMELPNVGVEWVCYVKITNGAVEFYDPTGETESVIYEAVEVPEHGRLIDADAFAGKYIAALPDGIEDLLDKRRAPELISHILALLLDIAEEPTIIPADKEGEDNG